MTKRGCHHFMAELGRLVDRLRQEYVMTYAEVIGCLELMKLSIAAEEHEETEETDELDE